MSLPACWIKTNIIVRSCSSLHTVYIFSTSRKSTACLEVAILSACAASRSNAVIAALEVGQMRPKCLRPTSSWYSMTRLGLMVRSHLLCASLRRAMRCCARDSNSMYFSGGVHTYAALRAGPSTPYKRWSKCTMKKIGGRFLQELRGEVRYSLLFVALAALLLFSRCCHWSDNRPTLHWG